MAGYFDYNGEWVDDQAVADPLANFSFPHPDNYWGDYDTDYAAAAEKHLAGQAEAAQLKEWAQNLFNSRERYSRPTKTNAAGLQYQDNWFIGDDGQPVNLPYFPADGGATPEEAVENPGQGYIDLIGTGEGGLNLMSPSGSEMVPVDALRRGGRRGGSGGGNFFEQAMGGIGDIFGGVAKAGEATVSSVIDDVARPIAEAGDRNADIIAITAAIAMMTAAGMDPATQSALLSGAGATGAGVSQAALEAGMAGAAGGATTAGLSGAAAAGSAAGAAATATLTGGTAAGLGAGALALGYGAANALRTGVEGAGTNSLVDGLTNAAKGLLEGNDWLLPLLGSTGLNALSSYFSNQNTDDFNEDSFNRWRETAFLPPEAGQSMRNQAYSQSAKMGQTATNNFFSESAKRGLRPASGVVSAGLGNIERGRMSDLASNLQNIQKMENTPMFAPPGLQPNTSMWPGVANTASTMLGQWYNNQLNPQTDWEALINAFRP